MAYPLISATTNARRLSPAEMAADEERTQRYFRDIEDRLSYAEDQQRAAAQTRESQQERFARVLWAEQMRRLDDPGRSRDVELRMESKLAAGRGEDEEQFIPGRGFVSPREARAIFALRAQGAAPAGEYTADSPAWLTAPKGLVEGILAGLSSDTEDSQGFLPEFQKGVMGFVSPEDGVDEATKERLYGRLNPVTRMVTEMGLDPINHLWPMASMRTSAGRHVASIPAVLETTSGERIRKLLPAYGPPGRRVMPRALP
jgi:hypothetical protein